MTEYEETIDRIRELLDNAEALIIGAGSGLSTAAGYVYTGPRFNRWFSDFGRKYGFSDMYSGGFTRFENPREQWAFWSRYVWVNRYMPIPTSLYDSLLRLTEGKDTFVLTTNVDHCFQRAGFDRSRLFYTQGDYGLFQCSKPCHKVNYDNETIVRDMLLSQGWRIAGNNELMPPETGRPAMEISSDLIPHCPRCGRPMSMNLRADATFVEDAGWHEHAALYTDFLKCHSGCRTVFLELGVGYNTPGIIKYPFMRMTYDRPDAHYICLNRSKAYAPKEIQSRSVCLNADLAAVIAALTVCKG